MTGLVVALATIIFLSWLIGSLVWIGYAADEWRWKWWGIPVAVAPFILGVAFIVGLLVEVLT